jgi:transcriptional regulator with XRE-family HTH domain
MSDLPTKEGCGLMSIGKNIKFYRKQKKMTQIELAERANMSRSYLADIERDRYNPSIETLKSIAKALQIDVSSLIEGDTNDSSSKQDVIPSWATKKDIRDFKKMLEEDEELMFDGVPLDDEDRERIKQVLTALFWDAKKRNKRNKPTE